MGSSAQLRCAGERLGRREPTQFGVRTRKGPARASSAGEKSGPAGAGSLNSERSERQKSERSEDFFFGKKQAPTLTGWGLLSLFPREG